MIKRKPSKKYKQRSYRNRGKWNREGKIVWKKYQIARRARRADLKKQAKQLKRLKRKT